MNKNKKTRRAFLKRGLGAAAVTGFPAIVPSSVFGQNAPSNRINVGAIGVGRISRAHDLPGIWQHDVARIMAVCDLDSKRVELGKAFINGHYAETTGKPYDGVAGYHRYQDLLANKDIDAVVISTPDHQHAICAVAAVGAGKDVYLQKPASLTIAEGRFLSDTVRKSGRIFQIGSQQRSWKQFHRACELVRNGRVGQLKHVEIGLPGDPSGPEAPKMLTPQNLNYDAWLGHDCRDVAQKRCKRSSGAGNSGCVSGDACGGSSDCRRLPGLVSRLVSGRQISGVHYRCAAGAQDPAQLCRSMEQHGRGLQRDGAVGSGYRGIEGSHPAETRFSACQE